MAISPKRYNGHHHLSLKKYLDMPQTLQKSHSETRSLDPVAAEGPLLSISFNPNLKPIVLKDLQDRLTKAEKSDPSEPEKNFVALDGLFKAAHLLLEIGTSKNSDTKFTPKDADLLERVAGFIADKANTWRLSFQDKEPGANPKATCEEHAKYIRNSLESVPR